MANKLVEEITEMGWQFYQDSPNEGKWMKFNEEGVRIAVEGDDTWKADMRAIK